VWQGYTEEEGRSTEGQKTEGQNTGEEGCTGEEEQRVYVQKYTEGAANTEAEGRALLPRPASPAAYFSPYTHAIHSGGVLLRVVVLLYLVGTAPAVVLLVLLLA
jgi:hypothetical protein